MLQYSTIQYNIMSVSVSGGDIPSEWYSVFYCTYRCGIVCVIVRTGVV
jgi:hypothetical protein